MTPSLLSYAPLALPNAAHTTYHLHEQVGQGGYSQIFRAWDSLHQRWVAIKLLRDLPEKQQMRGRCQLRNEAAVLSRLQHPAIPDLYAYDASLPMVVLPYIEGYALTTSLQHAKRGLPLGDIAVVGRNVCNLLTYLHRQQIVHGDLSANNLLIDQDGSMFLIDFGIARQSNQAYPPELVGLGTQGYAAPECYPGTAAPITPAADIYSAGALLHYACTGKDPSHRADPFAFPSLPTRITSELRELVWAMLDPSPSGRPPLQEIKHVLENQRQASI